MENLNKPNELYALVRFLASLAVLSFMVWIDLLKVENIPPFVYGIIGSMNGLDIYRLFKEINKRNP